MITPAVHSEQVVRDALAALLDGAHPGLPKARVLTETPANLQDILPAIQVETTNSTEHVLTLEVAQVTISTFGPDRIGTRDTSMQVHAAITMLLPGTLIDTAFIAEVAVIQRPKYTPYGNTGIRRFTALYQIAVRSVPTA